MIKPAIALLLLTAAAVPAQATGPGRYRIDGHNPDGTAYGGSLTLTATGDHVWSVTWRIGSQTIQGFGVGDVNVLSVAYQLGSSLGAVLYLGQKDGSYKGVWSVNGATHLGTENLTPE